MATLTLKTGAVDPNLAASWVEESGVPASGDTLVFNASSGTMTGPITVGGAAAFHIQVTAGYNLTISDLLDFVANSITNVTLTTAGVLTYDNATTIAGAVSLNASTMNVTANAAITGTVALAEGSVFTFNSTGAIGGAVTVNGSTMTVGPAAGTLGSTLDLVDSTYTHSSTGTITGAVTADSASEYNATASHTVTGGITNAGTVIVSATKVLTSGVILAGGVIDLTTTGAITGAISDTAADNEIDMGTAGVITGTIDLDAGACAWSGVGTATINATSNLELGGAATGLTIIINDGAGTQTVTCTAAISCAAMTMTNCSAFDMSTFAHTFAAGFTQTAGTAAGTGSITINSTGPLKLSTALVTLDVALTGGTVMLGSNISVESLTINCTALVCAAYTVTITDNCVHTAGTITSTGDWTMIGTGTLNLVCATIPLIINTAGTITANGAISVKTLTLTTATAFAFGAYPITVAGSAVQAAGTLTSTGLWTITATATLTIQTTIAGAYFNITGGTCTLGDDLDIAGLQIQSGATLDADSNGMTLAVGRITGYGTVATLVPAGAIHVAPGLADGGSNHANVIFDPTPMPLVI